MESPFRGNQPWCSKESKRMKQKRSKGRGKRQFLVRQALLEDLSAMCKFDRDLLQSPENHLSYKVLETRMRAYPDGVFVLLDQNEQICGRAKCLPLKPGLEVQLSHLTNLHHDIYSESVLPSIEAQNRVVFEPGNLCLAEMIAVDPDTQEERYDHAVPLFLRLLSQFYILRM